MPSVTDAPPEIAEMVRARLMALSGAERFLMGIRTCEAARRMVLASLPAKLPESDRAVLRRAPSAPKSGSIRREGQRALREGLTRLVVTYEILHRARPG